MFDSSVAENKWKEARQKHIEKVALKRSKRKKKPVLHSSEVKRMSSSKPQKEKKIDPRSLWYHPTLSTSFINLCQHGVSRGSECARCADDSDE
jgi:hypothetical protein